MAGAAPGSRSDAGPGCPALRLEGVVDRARSSSLVLVAEPVVPIERTNDGHAACTMSEWSEFNPIAGIPTFQPQSKIRMWMPDTSFDSTQFYARRIHFPKSLRRVKNRKLLADLLGPKKGTNKLDNVFGWTSHPFPGPDYGEIALRIVTVGAGLAK